MGKWFLVNWLGVCDHFRGGGVVLLSGNRCALALKPIASCPSWANFLALCYPF